MTNPKPLTKKSMDEETFTLEKARRLNQSEGSKKLMWRKQVDKKIKSSIEYHSEQTDKDFRKLFDMYDSKPWKTAIDQCLNIFHENKEKAFPTLYTQETEGQKFSRLLKNIDLDEGIAKTSNTFKTHYCKKCKRKLSPREINYEGCNCQKLARGKKK